MKIKKLFSVTCCLLVGVLTLTACGINLNMEQKSPGKNLGTIALSVSTLNNPFFVSLGEGAKAKAEELDLDFLVLDSDASVPITNEAMKKGIKVVSVDSVINGAKVDAQISSDNVEGGKIAAQYILDKVGKGAKVVEIEGIPGNSTTIQHGEGFHKIADENLNVVAKQTANFNHSEGLSVMENILQANPDIKAVFAHNDEMALGAIEAIGDKDILVVGFDAIEDVVQAIKDGKMDATIEQKPSLLGEKAVYVASSLLVGHEFQQPIKVEVELIENVENNK